MRLVICALSLVSFANALFFGCGCRQCACGGSTYGYGGYGYGYQQQSSYPSYSSYPSSSSYFSPYGPGQISGYILRPVGPVETSGYAVAGGYNGGPGIPVMHSQIGQIGYLRASNGAVPDGPFYWQPSQGAAYERVLVNGLRL